MISILITNMVILSIVARAIINHFKYGDSRDMLYKLSLHNIIEYVRNFNRINFNALHYDAKDIICSINFINITEYFEYLLCKLYTIQN